jgi:hypothetical protein
MAETLGDILVRPPLSTGECHFLVWAPNADNVKLRILNTPCRSIHSWNAFREAILSWSLRPRLPVDIYMTLAEMARR